MATSNTVGQTTIDVAKIIEHAARKCGMLASSLSVEQLESAKENLFLQLISLSNRGLNLWCIERAVTPTRTEVAQYTLPLGVVDLLNVLWREGSAQAATVFTPPYASYDFGAGVEVNVQSASVTAPAGSGTARQVFTLQSSDDGAAWNDRGSATFQIGEITAGDRIGVDAPGAVAARYWRVSVSPSATFTAATFIYSARDLPFAALNRDNYAALPNKNFTSGTVLQYWFDRQAARSYLWVWPVPNSDNYQVVVWYQRQIQDVGTLRNTLQLPDRWLNSVIYDLSHRIGLELPPEQIKEERLTLLAELAEKYTREAEDGERDGAPLMLMPNISPYTRG